MNASMMDSLEVLSEPWAAWMTAMSWQVAALVGVVLALTLVFKKMPAGLRYLLWMLVFVKLVLPPDLATPWSVGNAVETARVSYWEEAGPLTATEDSNGVAVGALEDATYRTYKAYRSYEPAGLTEPAGTPRVAPRAISLLGGAMLLWAGIGGLLLLFLAVQYIRYSRRLLIGAAAPSDDVSELLPSLLKQARLKRNVRVMTSSAVQTPAVFGLWRPVVLLPEGWEIRFSAEELSAVLLHELAHIRRGDLLTGWVTSLLTCLYWFHPAVWFANFCLRREREMACDDAVLEATKVEGKRYASTILRVAESFDGRVPAGAGFLGLLELSDNLLHRIRSVADSKRIRRLGWSSLIVLVLVVIVAVPMGVWTSDTEAEGGAGGGTEELANGAARIMVDTQAGRDAVVKMLEASSQLSLLKAERIPTERLIDTVFLDRGEAYLVTFAPIAPFVPKDRIALLETFNASHPREVRSHHYRTVAADDGSLTGLIMMDGPQAEDAVRKAYDGNAKIRILKVEAVTMDLLAQTEPYAKEVQDGVYDVSFAPKPPFAPKNERELLDAFNANYPKGVATHHFRWKTEEEESAPDAQEIELGHIMVDTEAGRDAIVKMLDASSQLRLVESKPLSTEELVERLFLERGAACLVTFVPVAPFAPKDTRELLDAFHVNFPDGVRSHHYRTRAAEDGSLTGFIMMDGTEVKDIVEKAYTGHPKIRVLKVETVTIDLLKQTKPYDEEIQDGVYEVTFVPKPPFAPKNARELLDAFNAHHPKGIRTHHFRVTTKTKSAPSPISLVKIKKWPDGSLRAGLKTHVLKYYKEGEEFEGYRVLRIDEERQQVEVYSEANKGPITLTFVPDSGGA